MRNYIKSELYRILHTSEIYLITGTLTVLSVLFNLGTGLIKTRYSNTSFSYSCLVANPMIFACTGAVIAYFLYEGSRRNGSCKNAVSCGISRIKIFTGKCIVAAAVSTIVMTATLAAWITGAELLLKKSGPVHLNDLLSEVPAIYLIAAACLISVILCLECFEKNISGILIWGAIWFFIPKMIFLLAIRFQFLLPAALWFPHNLFTIVNGQHVNTQECITAWNTLNGMLKCLISGFTGTILFTLSGILLLRKRDL